MKKLKLNFEEVTVEISLEETPCAEALYQAAPFESRARLWGEEIYFETPVDHDLDETARDLVELGEVGYWPEGQALCLFFGPTPISQPGEIRPASVVNLVGKILTPLERLSKVAEGSKVLVERGD